MKIEQLRSQFTTKFEELLPLVSESLEQLFGRKFIVRMEISKDTDVISHVSGAQYPCVYVQYLTLGTGEFKHIIALPIELARNLYAWMIGAEPEESFGDEQIDGLQEGGNQIFGQLQASLQGGNTSFNVKDLKVALIESEKDAISALQPQEGLCVTYPVTIEKESFQVRHYLWVTAAENSLSDNEISEIVSSVDKESQKDEKVDIHSVEFQPLNDSHNGNGNDTPRNLNILMDVELESIAELGRKKMRIKDILKLGKGSVIELDKAAGENLDIFISGRKFAEGEVVVIDDHFGIRITQLLGPKERIKSLK